MAAIRDKESAISYLHDGGLLNFNTAIKVQVVFGNTAEKKTLKIPCYQVGDYYAHLDENRWPNIIDLAKSLRDLEIAQLKLLLNFYDSVGIVECATTCRDISSRRERLKELVIGKDSE